MDFSDYDKLLDRAYGQLPEVTKKSVRFEMPQVDVFFEGNKTILKNFSQVAKILNRDESHLQKFLTKDLGAYSLLSGDRLIFSKKLFGKKIGDSVKKYAAEYVICPQCGKPDTQFTSLEGVKILKCEACGGWKPLKNI
jgi:translation initiation factor 2 subunit 2